MISSLLKSLRPTIAFRLFLSVFYIFILWLFAQTAGPNKGNAGLVTLSGKIVGTANVDQNFTQGTYLWGRPSHADDGYDVSNLAGSSKRPSNEEHLALLKERIDAFLVHHSYLTREKVPVEIVTISSSDLGPHISPKTIYTQAERVTDARRWSEEKVVGIVNSHVEKPLLGTFGTGKINVLKLNVMPDRASNNK